MSKAKQKSLNQIRNAITDNNVCPQLAGSATQLVFGDGSTDAEIMFVGEAPGKNEDLLGKPFVGAAGKFLDEMLASINLKRDDVYITNIVKYRPPDNRDPSPSEKAAFLPYLQAQIEVIQPKVVVLLGRHSTNCFLPGLQISKVHGRAFRKIVRFVVPLRNKRVEGMQGYGTMHNNAYHIHSEGVYQLFTQPSGIKPEFYGNSASRQVELSLVFLPLFHPAAALYNGGMKQTLMEDFAKIPRILKTINMKTRSNENL